MEQIERVNLAGVLVEHGTDVTAQDREGFNPLHLTARMGSVCVVVTVLFLVEHGADATAQAKDGSTPLYLVSQGEWIKHF